MKTPDFRDVRAYQLNQCPGGDDGTRKANAGALAYYPCALAAGRPIFEPARVLNVSFIGRAVGPRISRQ
jgi:hypothetical protein